MLTGGNSEQVKGSLSCTCSLCCFRGSAAEFIEWNRSRLLHVRAFWFSELVFCVCCFCLINIILMLLQVMDFVKSTKCLQKVLCCYSVFVSFSFFSSPFMFTWITFGLYEWCNIASTINKQVITANKDLFIGSLCYGQQAHQLHNNKKKALQRKCKSF